MNFFEKTISYCKNKIQKKTWILLLCCFVFWCAIFIYEGVIFKTANIPNRIGTYIIIKILTFLTIFAIVNFVYKSICGFKERNKEFYIFLFSLPFIVLTTLLWLKFGVYPFVGDELNIYNSAILFENLNGVFGYFSTYSFMIAFQIFPFAFSIVLFKIVFSGIIVGYIVYRINKLLKNKTSFIIYFYIFVSVLFFLLTGVLKIDRAIDLLYNVHRMPSYGFLYLFCACKMFCDYMEHEKLTKKTFFVLAILLSILTQWRVEGAYLFVLGLILIIVAYRVKLSKKIFLSAVSIFLTIQVVLYIPQIVETSSNKDYSKWRLTHFYNYAITNMMRNGLDEEKNKEELAIVDRYVSIEKIKEINATYGDNAYLDEYILFYGGLRENPTREIMLDYENAMNKIIINNLGVFLQSQFEAFNYITVFEKTGFIFSNLYIVFAILIAAFIYFCIKKNYFAIWFLLGVFGHSALTTILLPASYFKYYYMQYLVSIFFLVYFTGIIYNKIKSKIVDFKKNKKNNQGAENSIDV